MITVNTNQKGNNILNFLSKSTFCFGENIKTDYETANASIIFLSLKFHCVKPEYIYKRIKTSTKNRKILLLHADTVNYELKIEELFQIADTNNFILIIAFSNEECARYIQAFDINEKRSLDILRKKETNQKEIYETFLCYFPKINKTDASKIIGFDVNLNVFFNSKIENILGKNKSENIKNYLEMEFDK
ncbi:DNA excision repair protein ERCC-1 [Hamiltosporidium tvaerminnensis]|uniref:DNA excision repair protein ERCC-1 n=1 Tax=Hamiltosporidium tvaerminnensis TaxID=1176355 RepID=A0A4Q9LCI4_9MICR|nr:ssDNA endonuclease and repair protein rad10 [Hamiltosporidium tvaerminnensis]TBU05537.1 DNA excision repair protein ERCC-1 [Hamiltosporidium tvaerminnensis]